MLQRISLLLTQSGHGGVIGTYVKIEHRRGQSGGWIHESGSAPNRVGGSAMILSPECEAIILRAARRVPDALRDTFFSEVATRLKFLRHITETDVRHTSAAVLVGLLEESKQPRAAGTQ